MSKKNWLPLIESLGDSYVMSLGSVVVLLEEEERNSLELFQDYIGLYVLIQFKLTLKTLIE